MPPTWASQACIPKQAPPNNSSSKTNTLNKSSSNIASSGKIDPKLDFSFEDRQEANEDMKKSGSEDFVNASYYDMLVAEGSEFILSTP